MPIDKELHNRHHMKTLRYQMARLKELFPDLKYHYVRSIDDLDPLPGVVLEEPISEALQEALNVVGLIVYNPSTPDIDPASAENGKE